MKFKFKIFDPQGALVFAPDGLNRMAKTQEMVRKLEHASDFGSATIYTQNGSPVRRLTKAGGYWETIRQPK